MNSPTESITHGSYLPLNRRWVAAAFLMGLIFPIVPGLLIAARSTDPWVRREAHRAAQYQAAVMVIASGGVGLLQMGRSMSAAARLFHSGGASALFSAAMSAVAHSPAGMVLFLTGGLLTGMALAGWWLGNLLAAIGSLRGDSLGLPRFRARRSQS